MIRAKTNSIPIIDLTGPEGNAFVLLGHARKLSRQLGWNAAKSNSIQEEMTSGDYENLVETFDEYFGDYVILER